MKITLIYCAYAQETEIERSFNIDSMAIKGYRLELENNTIKARTANFF